MTWRCHGGIWHYRALCGDRVNEGRLDLRVVNYTMGGDPLPERRKWLRLLSWADGERHNVVVEEKNELRLP